MQDIVYFMQPVIHGGISPDRSILVRHAKLSNLCASCTITESGEINGKSAQSALKSAKKHGHSAQMGGYVFVHVAQ